MVKAHRIGANIWLWGMLWLLLIVMVLGTSQLNADAYWVDEVIAVQRAGLTTYITDSSIPAIWQRTAEISDQVPAYYILLAVWANTVGNTPFTGRLLSLLLGLLTIALVYQLGKRLYSPIAGFGAALMLSSSAFYMLFLHEMRMYALLLCMITLMLWCYWLIIHGKTNFWNQAGLVLSTALMLYSYYLSILMIAALCVHHLLFVKKDRKWWRVVFLMGLAGSLFLPWVLTSFSVFDDSYRNFIRQSYKQDRIQTIINIMAAFSNKNTLFFALCLIFTIRPFEKSYRYIWSLLLINLSLMFIFNTWLGVLVNLRYSLMLWIPLSLLMGLGISRIVSLGIPDLPIFALIGITGLFSILNPAVADEYDLPIRYMPWDDLIEILNVYQEEGDKLTFLVSIEGDDWEGVHEERVMPHYFHDSLVEPIFLEDVRNLPDEAFLNEVEAFITGAPRLWFTYPKKLPSWRNGMLQDFIIENGYANCGNFADTKELYLDLYAHPSAMNESIQFGESGESLVEFAPIQTLPSQVNDSLTLIHTWQLSDNLPRNVYSLAVHIYDENGNIVQQADYGLPIESFACVTIPIDVSELPTGTYHINSFVYAWQNGTRLSALSPNSLENESYNIGELTIQH